MKNETISPVPNSLITVDEAANLLGVKRQTLYIWVRQGAIPYYRVGKRLIKFDRDELMASFKVNCENVAVSRPPKIEVSAYPLAEPFRLLDKKESSEVNENRERYRALLGVVK